MNQEQLDEDTDLNLTIIKIGPFIFNDNTEWKDIQNQECEYKSAIIPKKQLAQFSRQYGKYKQNISNLNLSNQKFYRYFPYDCLNFLQKYKGKFQLDSLEDLNLTNNSKYQQSFEKQYNRLILIQKCFNTKSLCFFDLCNLSVLKLSKNRITSLENVIRACNKFPSLLELDLESNQITSVKPFIKSQMGSLCQLSLSVNNLTNPKHIYRCRMPNLQSLKLNINQISDFISIYYCECSVLSTLSTGNYIKLW